MEKNPHPIFTALWIVWYIGTFVAWATNDWVALGVFAAFFPVEILGRMITPNTRGTLSEIMTWAHRQVSKHTRWDAGWGAAVYALIMDVTLLLARTAWSLGGEDVWAGALAVALCGFSTKWLGDHWLRPDIHG